MHDEPSDVLDSIKERLARSSPPPKAADNALVNAKQ